VNARAEFKKGKSNSHKIEEARKSASLLINDLIDYSQRKDLMNFEKTKIKLKYASDSKNKFAELIACNGVAFLVKDNEIKKITNKIEPSNLDEFSKSVEEQKNKNGIGVNPIVFDLLKKELGDFEIVL
jgi:hypothetical protein